MSIFNIEVFMSPVIKLFHINVSQEFIATNAVPVPHTDGDLRTFAPPPSPFYLSLSPFLPTVKTTSNLTIVSKNIRIRLFVYLYSFIRFSFIRMLSFIRKHSFIRKLS